MYFKLSPSIFLAYKRFVAEISFIFRSKKIISPYCANIYVHKNFLEASNPQMNVKEYDLLIDRIAETNRQ